MARDDRRMTQTHRAEPALDALTAIPIMTRTSALGRGANDVELQAAVAAGQHVRVRPGHFVDADTWRSLFLEERLRVRALALVSAARGAPIIFSHATAAGIWRLPLPRLRDERVHITVPDRGAHSTRTVFRHRCALREHDVVWLHGTHIGVTSLARTSIDIARTALPETAISALDAALRLAGEDAAVLRAQWQNILDAEGAGARGIRQGRQLTAFADARAELVGESISRLYFARLSVPVLDLQAPVTGPSGEQYRCDFELEDAYGEFDGLGKYSDPGMLSGREASQVVIAEKRREDRIRGVTGRRIVRWTSAELKNPETFARHLRALGIVPQSPLLPTLRPVAAPRPLRALE